MATIPLYKKDESNTDSIEIIDTRVWRDTDTHTILFESKFLNPNVTYNLKIFKDNQHVLDFPEVYSKNGTLAVRFNKEEEKQFQTGKSLKEFKVQVYDKAQLEFTSPAFFRRKTKPKVATHDVSPRKSSSTSPYSSIETKFSTIENNDDDYYLSINQDSISTFTNSLPPSSGQHIEEDDDNTIDNFTLPAYSSIKMDNKVMQQSNDCVKSIDAFIIIINDSEKPKHEIVKKLDKHIYLIKADSKQRVANHAFRQLADQYKHLASFTVKDERDSKTRSGRVYSYDPTNDLINLLKNGIKVEFDNSTVDMVYIGHSNSGLKEGNLWAIDKESMEKINFNKFFHNLGDFSKIQTPEKLCKRYAQNFSTSLCAIKLKKSEYLCIPDDVTADGKYEFTDGIGLVRMSTAEDMSEMLKLDSVSYIFQIRCGGFKGVLVAMKDDVFDRIQKEKTGKVLKSIKVLFRESQRKYDLRVGDQDCWLNVVNWVNSEQICSMGSLNTQLLMILDGHDQDRNLGIRDYIIELFKISLKEVEDSMDDPLKAYSKLLFNSELSEFSVKFSTILLACEGKLSDNLDCKTHDIIRKQILKQHLIPTITCRKFSITLDKSFYLFGIIDESDTLEEDEVFVSYINSNGILEYLDNIDVVVGRMPCYALSELRRVRAKRISQLSHLVNCIAFSKKDNRPLTNILGGGDLDGDLYFVTFNENICKFRNTVEPIVYPKDTSAASSMNNTSPRDLIVEYVVRKLLIDTKTGLWHYCLLNLYDENRANMRQKKYIDAVFNINKCIDGIDIGNIEIPSTRKPNWYIKSQNGDDDFIKFLYNLKNYGLTKEFDNRNMSLVQELIRLACQQLRNIVETTYRQDGSPHLSRSEDFFTPEDVEILKDNDKIDLKLVENELESGSRFTRKELKDAFITYMHSINSTTKKIKDKDSSSGYYDGMVKRLLENEVVSKSTESKVRQKEVFRRFIIDFEYECEAKNNASALLKRTIHCDTGIFIQSRVFNIYQKLKNDPDSYYLAWEFYEILCSLKNYCRYKKHERLSKEFTSTTPFTIPFEYVKAFSLAKLQKINQ